MMIQAKAYGSFVYPSRLCSKVLLVLLFALLFSYASSVQAASDPIAQLPSSFITRAEAANPNNFKPIKINGRIIDIALASCPMETGLIACSLQKLDLINGGPAEVNADYDLAQTFIYPSNAQPNTAVVIITRSDLMDDSVSAERYRISFKSEKKPLGLDWNWVQYGVQYKCARGDNAGQWTKNLCP